MLYCFVDCISPISRGEYLTAYPSQPIQYSNLESSTLAFFPSFFLSPYPTLTFSPARTAIRNFIFRSDPAAQSSPCSLYYTGREYFCDRLALRTVTWDLELERDGMAASKKERTVWSGLLMTFLPDLMMRHAVIVWRCSEYLGGGNLLRRREFAVRRDFI